MRRWLVAVFALHFLLSVGAFAFGQLPADAPSQVQEHLMAEAATPGQPASDGTLKASHPQDHGLTDTQPDLPECLDVLIAASSRGEPLRTPSPPLVQDLTPPVLDGPQRPPRGTFVLA
ncbi:hypothetical protein [Hydrogenophaga laconesensis]|uniref:Uncharacterized protein n=1 Tax=Hydrogenophaga laconesensis TaxID=1805971 RepID=A0ABU1V7R2_9BURK|nr:hypothetical protein [Hydrogenophaga laconesensis]MDR7093494.1 hypothetical protein [Hydrogenophaga laconesensis]